MQHNQPNCGPNVDLENKLNKSLHPSMFGMICIICSKPMLHFKEKKAALQRINETLSTYFQAAKSTCVLHFGIFYFHAVSFSISLKIDKIEKQAFYNLALKQTILKMRSSLWVNKAETGRL